MTIPVRAHPALRLGPKMKLENPNIIDTMMKGREKIASSAAMKRQSV